MEYEVVRKELEHRKQLLIADVDTFKKGILDVIDYFRGLPQRWDVHYFHSGIEFRKALEANTIVHNSVVVLPSDGDLLPGNINVLARKQGVKLFILVGLKSRHQEDRQGYFYI
jgi:hypothetical protein